jgi:hypothetical protein
MTLIPNSVRLSLLALLVLPSICGCMLLGNIGGQFGHPDEVAQELPDFPGGWPPTASSYAKIPNRAFYNASTFGEAMNIVADSLYDNGYTEVSYFATKDGGIALVTKLERFGEDGAVLPDNERWSMGQDSKHDLFRILRNMYFEQRGRYRVFVFFLGPGLPLESSPKTLTLEEARSWRGTGKKEVLPIGVSKRPLGDAQCIVAVYEFESTGKTTKLVSDSRIPVELQLRRNGIVASLNLRR